MEKLLCVFGMIFLLGACASKEDYHIDAEIPISSPDWDSLSIVLLEQEKNVFIERAFEQIDLVDIHSVHPDILIDVRYSTDNNFMGKVLYDSLSKIYLNRDVAVRLGKVQEYLDSIQPGYRLLIFDGVRPLNVQREMWEAMDTIPVAERGKFVSNPALGSVHNYGAAVDITICDETGEQLDMGAGYDDFRPIAFPSKEAQFLKSGELTRHQWNNRKLLRKVMRSQRFYNIPSEWWHFNAWPRTYVDMHLPQLLSESGTYQFTRFSSISTHSDSLMNP